MQIKQSAEGNGVKLALEGRFDFHSHRDFRTAYEQVLENASAREITLSFDGVDYLDSSALGMLLLLREKAEAVNKKVVLSGLKGTVKQVLDIANFGRLFTIK